MAARKSGLGKGLDSLITNKVASKEEHVETKEVLSLIHI